MRKAIVPFLQGWHVPELAKGVINRQTRNAPGRCYPSNAGVGKLVLFPTRRQAPYSQVTALRGGWLRGCLRLTQEFNSCPLLLLVLSVENKTAVGPEFGGRRGVCAFCGAAVIVPRTSGVAQLAPQAVQAATRKSSTVWIVIACRLLRRAADLRRYPGRLSAAGHFGRAREAARRATVFEQAPHQIGLALRQYYATFMQLSSGDQGRCRRGQADNELARRHFVVYG